MGRYMNCEVGGKALKNKGRGKGSAGCGDLLLFVTGPFDKGSLERMPQRKEGLCHPTSSGKTFHAEGTVRAGTMRWCVCIPGLLEQSTKSWMALNSRNLLSHVLGARHPKSKC